MALSLAIILHVINIHWYSYFKTLEFAIIIIIHA